MEGDLHVNEQQQVVNQLKQQLQDKESEWSTVNESLQQQIAGYQQEKDFKEQLKDLELDYDHINQKKTEELPEV